jgi:hypothetical protein
VYYYWFKKAQKRNYLFFFIRFAKNFLLKKGNIKIVAVDEEKRYRILFKKFIWRIDSGGRQANE